MTIVHYGCTDKHNQKTVYRTKSFVFFPSLNSNFISQDVCRQMDSVFKELLSRQVTQEPCSPKLKYSAQAPQKKGKRDGRKGKGAGLFKGGDLLDWEDWHQQMTRKEEAMIQMKTEV